MKITDVKATVLKGFGDWIITKIVTDEGITGYGEIFPAHAGKGPGMVELVKWMKDPLLGENPLEIKRLYRKMHDRYLMRGGSMAGLVTMAMGGIEIALWDIKGKYLGVPVHTLLGGKFRDSVRVYADCHAGAAMDMEEDPRAYEEDKSIYDPVSYAEKATEVLNKGFTALKFDIDVPTRFVGDPYNRHASNAELAYIVSVVDAVRSAVGPDVDLAIDCHSAYDVISAIKIAVALEPHELMWLEDPIPPENIDGFCKLTESTRTPICTGENFYTKFGFKEILGKQAVDIIEPDLQKAGGLYESLSIADLAELYSIPVAPHCVVSPIGTLASVHLTASIPNFSILEFHMIDIPWWGDLIVGGDRLIQKGFIAVPESPGLGIEINDMEFDRYNIGDRNFLES
jgi:L-alanine-DL-glutamate epimerase-like enolase superfamily enzyme